MRVLVLVPSVPSTLDAKVPWHFLQELQPMVRAGVRFCVASGVQPGYTLEGVEFRKLERAKLKHRPMSAVAALLLAWRKRAVLPSPGSAGCIAKLLRVCQWNLLVRDLATQWRPQLIHSHWAFPMGSAGVLAAEQLGIPLVMTLRGYEHLVAPRFGYGACLDPFHQAMLKLALNRSAAITVCCSDSHRRLKELDISEDTKLHTILHAVDASRFDGSEAQAAALKQELRLAGRRVITCVARMDHESKGHATLLHAFSMINRTLGDTRLLLVGDGPLLPDLELLAQDLKIRDRTVFHGRAHPSEIQHFMRLSDVTVLPTHCEAFGNVVFESLAVGTPVISGAVGTARDILPLGPYGELFPPGDAEALRAAIERVLERLDDYRAMALRGRDFVYREMSLDRRAEAFVQIYEQVTRASRDA